MTTTNLERPLALVLGATGGIGRTVAHQLAAKGWHVVAMNRDPVKASKAHPDFDWVRGDAMRPEDVISAARGASVIVHGVNPPGYLNWDKLAVPMLESTIAAAKAVGATILFPGNIYNFGPDSFPGIAEDSPQHPVTKKGKIRVEMENRLKAAAERGVQSIVVRAGDFIGPGAPSSWFSAGMVQAGKPVSMVINPARRGVAHQWVYLPDMADTMVRLLEKRHLLGRFENFHMRGYVDPDGEGLVASIRQVTGRKPLVIRFPWLLVPLAGPFVPFLKELWEMRYLWHRPVIMSNRRLVEVLGEEPNTPIDMALKQTLASMRSL